MTEGWRETGVAADLRAADFSTAFYSNSSPQTAAARTSAAACPLLFIPRTILVLQPDTGGAVGGNLLGAGMADALRRGTGLLGNGRGNLLNYDVQSIGERHQFWLACYKWCT